MALAARDTALFLLRYQSFKILTQRALRVASARVQMGTPSPQKAKFTLVGERAAGKVRYTPLNEVSKTPPNTRVNVRGQVVFKSLAGKTRSGPKERIILELADDSGKLRLSVFDDAMTFLEDTCPCLCHVTCERHCMLREHELLQLNVVAGTRATHCRFQVPMSPTSKVSSAARCGTGRLQQFACSQTKRLALLNIVLTPCHRKFTHHIRDSVSSLWIPQRMFC